jgi:hypothetical protein
VGEPARFIADYHVLEQVIRKAMNDIVEKR